MDSENGACPRCGAPTRAGDRYCAACGLRLPGTSGPTRSRARTTDFIVLLGPAIGVLIGGLLGEALVGHLDSDGPVVLPVLALAFLGAILGGPALAWLVDRTR